MRSVWGLTLVAILSILLSACPAAQPPPTEEPTELEVSGTLVGWTGSEAFIILTGSVSGSSTGDPETDGVQLGEPFYGSTVSSDGSFQVTLTEPDPAKLTQLTCGNDIHAIGFLELGVVSSVSEPTQNEDVLGVYTLGPPDSMVQDAVWLYSEEALEVEGRCSLSGGSVLDEVILNLAPGWNEAILTLGPQVQLESSPVPESFVWSEF